MIAKRVAVIGMVLAPLVGALRVETPEPPAGSSSATSTVTGRPVPLPGSTPPGTGLRFGDKA